MDADAPSANMEVPERSSDERGCRRKLATPSTAAGIIDRRDLMEERQQPSDFKGRRRGFGPVMRFYMWLRINRSTGLAALTAIALVAVGIGTSRDSDGAASGVASSRPSSRPSSRGLDLRAGVAPSDVPSGTVDVGLDAGAVLSGTRHGVALDLADANRSVLAIILPDRFGRSTVLDAPSLDIAELGATAPASDPSNVRTYNGRPVRSVAVLHMRVTAYSPDERSCGASADGITASGYSVLTNGGFLVAADPRVLPLGSLVSIPGYDDGAIVPVLDTGGAIKGNRLDVLYPSHEIAVQWGVQELDVEVWEYADGLPSGFRRVRRAAK